MVLEKVLEKEFKNKVPEAHTDYIVSVISEEFAIMIFFILFFNISI